MRYSISQVAKIAGVTSRTLRHYDAIGLLAPAETAGNGYRWYGRPELLRLQRILLLRQSGVPLAEIGQVLAGELDEVAALETQRTQIMAERDRLTVLIGTIDRTIVDLTGAPAMAAEDFFVGLSRTRSRLQATLIAQQGAGVDRAFAAAMDATASWTQAQYEAAATQNRHLLQQMALLLRRGIDPGAEIAQALVDAHHESVAQHWQPTAQTYASLADLYLDDDTQRSWIADVDPDLPDWLAAGMRHYATHRIPAELLPAPSPKAEKDVQRGRELRLAHGGDEDGDDGDGSVTAASTNRKH